MVAVLQSAPAVLWLLSIGLVFNAGCSKSSLEVPPIHLEGATMGTTYTIRYVAEHDTPSPNDIHRLIDEELDRVSQQMSTYIPDSEICTFNRSESTDWFVVSSETAQVVELAHQISVASSGAFDVTVAPLVDLWGFGPSQDNNRIPADLDIEATKATVGYGSLDVRLDPPGLRKRQSKLSIDLSAIAKGHGVDRVGSVLSRQRIKHYFVEIGGEIAARGVRPDGEPWQVGIEAPIEGRAIQTVVGLSDAAIATSGDYRNYFEHDGQRYSHTINPTTGRPVTHALASASVIAENCALADAIATCMMVLGPEEGYKLAEEKRWSVMLLRRDADRISTVCTSRFSERFPGVLESASPK
jgi:FAD:protein FMN transferase